jgi:TolA-binding protein
MLLARDWLEKNWQIVAIIAAIVIVVIVAVVYFINLQASKKYEAADQLTLAISKLRMQNYQEAITDLQSIVDNYGGTMAALAQFNLANAYYESRNYEQAGIQYNNYIDNYHHDRLTTASAIAGVAASMESQQQFGAAGDKYIEAARYYPEGANAPDYYVSAVRCYAEGGDREKAETALDEIEEKFPNSPHYQTAAQLIMKVLI